MSRESGGVTPLPPTGQPRVSKESGIAAGGGGRGLEVNAVLTSMLQSENIWNLRHLCIFNRVDVPVLVPAWPPLNNCFLHDATFDYPKSVCNTVNTVNKMNNFA